VRDSFDKLTDSAPERSERDWRGDLRSHVHAVFEGGSARDDIRLAVDFQETTHAEAL
jgi:hypothetical protein